MTNRDKLDRNAISVQSIRSRRNLKTRRRKRRERRERLVSDVPEAVPTPERAARGVERFEKPIPDSQGLISRPWRAIDNLGALERRGVITPEMRAAGEAFRNEFRTAQLDPLRAADLDALPFHGARMSEQGAIAMARKSVWSAIKALGGMQSPGGSCVWNVVGWELSLKEWLAVYGYRWRLRPTEATGVLIGALGVLAGQ